jgi:hypothetical protein
MLGPSRLCDGRLPGSMRGHWEDGPILDLALGGRAGRSAPDLGRGRRALSAPARQDVAPHGAARSRVSVHDGDGLADDLAMIWSNLPQGWAPAGGDGDPRPLTDQHDQLQRPRPPARAAPAAERIGQALWGRDVNQTVTPDHPVVRARQ